ncbi:unnamed protein product [Oikopleura dioica]|uniref:Protein kinase domain-containing protein n=1 Tax=Oikopleura dioica TaxID=34765 RepID=E4YKK2_OIKDI|nr:unnamed protein product [Oikopleura dioica]
MSDINLASFVAQIDQMKERIQSQTSSRRPRPPPTNLNLSATSTRPSVPSSLSLTSSRVNSSTVRPRMKPGSLDFSNRRNGFNTAQSFEPQNVPLLGLGTVELDSVPYRNVTEKNFTSHDTSAWLGSGTSGTVFKMNFMGKRQVAVKQIPKSDDPDEIKRLRITSARLALMLQFG